MISFPGAMFDWGALGAFVSVVLIDIVLAGDNAVVVGMAAASLPPAQRRRAIVGGIIAATVLRIALASVALELLAMIGLTLAGGLLLLWVAWKLYRDLAGGAGAGGAPTPLASIGFGRALWRIVVADLSMSLDNVLAVAGTASGRFWVLVCGLVLSVALMGIAADFTARLVGRYRFVAWIGLAIVTFAALRMIYDGSAEVARALSLGSGFSKNWLL